MKKIGLGCRINMVTLRHSPPPPPPPLLYTLWIFHCPQNMVDNSKILVSKKTVK